LARGQRRQAATVADVAGYSRLRERHKSSNPARLRRQPVHRLESVLTRHDRRMVKPTGNGALIEIAGAEDAPGAAAGSVNEAA